MRQELLNIRKIVEDEMRRITREMVTEDVAATAQTMPRLIDADALMEAFRTYMAENHDREKCVSEENCNACDRWCLWRKVVVKAPTIDPESLRPHGRWEKSEDGYCGLALLECSLCRGECFDIDEDIELLNYRYCPNCGAKMDLEEEMTIDQD